MIMIMKSYPISKSKRLNTRIFLPSLLSALSAIALSLPLTVWSAPKLACGTVSDFAIGPHGNDIFKAKIVKIDGKGVIADRPSFKIPAGQHKITLVERMSGPTVLRGRQTSSPKEYDIEVEQNKIYHFAAQYNIKQRFHREDYWKPIVWKTGEIKCTS